MNGIRLCSTSTLEWEALGQGNVRQKVVRNDPATGQFLGMMSLDALARTGLHKHLGVAFALHLSGSSTNHSAVVRAGQLGITLPGTVHDTVIYEAALTIVRTEGQTMFPPPVGGEVHLHSGAILGEMKADDQGGCLTIVPESLTLMPTAVAGVGRRILFDYLPTGKKRRLLDFSAVPGSTIQPHLATDRLEFFIIAGDLSINGLKAGSTDFVLVEPGTQVQWETSFGCRFLVWADGPADWSEEGTNAPDLYGFGV